MLPRVQREALFAAVSCFHYDDYTLSMMPDFVKAGLKYPSGYTPPEDEPTPKPEDVLKYIPGSIWVDLIVEAKKENLDGFEQIVTKLLRDEIVHLPRAVYYLSEAMKHKGEEPPNYNYLRETSILRGIVTALQTHLSGRTLIPEDRLEALLRILSQKLERSLPPLDWSFFQDVVMMSKNESLRTSCLNVCATQAPVSR